MPSVPAWHADAAYRQPSAQRRGFMLYCPTSKYTDACAQIWAPVCALLVAVAESGFLHFHTATMASQTNKARCEFLAHSSELLGYMRDRRNHWTSFRKLNDCTPSWTACYSSQNSRGWPPGPLMRSSSAIPPVIGSIGAAPAVVRLAAPYALVRKSLLIDICASICWK